MKRRANKRKSTQKAGKAGKTRASSGSPSGVGRALGEEALKISRGAQALQIRADAVHQTAEELHQSVERAHSGASAARGTAGRGQKATQKDHEPDSKQRGKSFPIVAIGGSAGGFEAFVEFLKELPKDTGFAYVFVQHLDPKHRSRLSELLQHSTALPVIEVRNETEIKPDRVYVMPENTFMTISDGRLRLGPRQMKEMPPTPIDMFFRSLAAERQHQAIAVVLSGTGSDGTLGVEAIKGEGGITFAQDERSAKYFGMPGSAIAGGSIDMVLSPSEIAREIARISQHPLLAPKAAPARAEAKAATEVGDLEKVLSESSKELQTLFGLLRARTGVDFAFYKHSTLKRRIVRRMILHKIDTLSQYIPLVEAGGEELEALFKDLLINVTNFFRDPQAFALLKSKVFPRLIKAHPDDSPLRMWVCGCSTGEEAYSLAITVTEFFEQTRSHRQVQIFATDISDAGIEKARAAIYPENIQQDVSPERLRRFFSKMNGSYQVHKTIRDMCVFARQNVLVDPPFSNLDLICCRNVLIYFGPTLQRKIIPVFHYALRPTGFLMLGSSETIGASAELFNLINKKYKLYLKKPSYLRPTFELGDRAREREAAAPERAAKHAAPRELSVLDLQQQVDRILLREFSPGAVVVTAEMEVVQFRGRTGEYLEHAPGTPSLNLLKLARESIAMDLRAALSKAIKQDVTVRQTGVQLKHNGRTRAITIEVVPFKVAALNERFFLVAFKELEPAPLLDFPRDARETSRSRNARERREISKLKLDLMATKESMQSIIEEQEATNEELKSANEEIQSSNEELQSTNEELETAKEELQSTNEELTTLNEELQNRNAELSLANNDLTNLLASVNIAVLMLGEDLTIRRFTPMAERIFNLIPSDVGRRLGEMNRSILAPDLESTVRNVIDNLSSVEREVQDREGRWYSLRVRPYRTRENRIDGAVILLVDIDELNRSLEGIMGTVSQPLLSLGPDFRVRHVNEAFRRLFGLSQETVQNKLVYEMGEGEWDLPALHKLLEEGLPQNKHMTNIEIEANFGKAGPRRLRLHARRFFEEGRGMQMILIAIETLR